MRNMYGHSGSVADVERPLKRGHYLALFRTAGGRNHETCALYMRISTKGHGQTTETQALALRDYAANRGFEIVGEYRDKGISGSKDSRPALDRLMKDARARKF